MSVWPEAGGRLHAVESRTSAPGEPKRRGMLITLEGPDGAGKSSQQARLVERLRAGGRSVVATREPGGTEIGERIRTILLTPEPAERPPLVDALLFNAARCQLVTEVIAPALSRGQCVVCDRYADSTLAYQGFGEGVDLARLRAIEEVATGGLTPDLTILLDAPVEVVLTRRAAGAEVSGGAAGAEPLTRFEQGGRHGRAFHERVREGYLALAAADPLRWRIIDADRPEEQVARAVLDQVLGLFSARSEPPARLARMEP